MYVSTEMKLVLWVCKYLLDFPAMLLSLQMFIKLYEHVLLPTEKSKRKKKWIKKYHESVLNGRSIMNANSYILN